MPILQIRVEHNLYNQTRNTKFATRTGEVSRNFDSGTTDVVLHIPICMSWLAYSSISYI
ncbi:predicted protein [Botrytis cinerea T4]|uniref:Uncharacterized protein n=1 Tax=Botryotinia fuckeliana (strain T4) TaxID=999810 RepID=G2Y0B7_BOTF4|nr:predicted protein [Botrytis cinerea T4]